MENFKVGINPSVVLEDLFAEVKIITGESGVITIEISGDEKSLKDIVITQKSSDEILIKGKGSSKDNITIINSGSKSSISMNNFSSHGKCVIIGGGNIIINGKKISGTDTIDEIKPVQIKITVPNGTSLDACDILKLFTIGLNGKLKLSLSGQNEAVISGAVKKINIKCSGQSSAKVTNAEGETTLSTSGQSCISIQGNLEDIEADTSGQSTILIQGNCVNIEANSSGQSSITLKGKATGRVREHSSGQSHIRI